MWITIPYYPLITSCYYFVWRFQLKQEMNRCFSSLMSIERRYRRECKSSSLYGRIHIKNSFKLTMEHFLAAMYHFERYLRTLSILLVCYSYKLLKLKCCCLICIQTCGSSFITRDIEWTMFFSSCNSCAWFLRECVCPIDEPFFRQFLIMARLRI